LILLNEKPLICIIVSSSEAYSGPSDLQILGETTNSLRFRWTSAGGPVSGYVVQYRPLSGLGQPITSELRQVRRMLILNDCSFFMYKLWH